QAERWADLVVVLNHHVAMTADDAERLELELRRVSTLTRELGTPKLAIEAAQAAIERHGAEPRLLAAWADAATAAGERAMVAEARLAQAKATEDRHDRGRWLAEAAAIQVELGDRERARALVHELTAGEVVDPGTGLALVGVVDDPTLALALAQAVAAAAP